jgi:hypothetical protein
MGNFDIYKTGKNNGEIPVEEKPVAIKEENKTEPDSNNKKIEIEAAQKVVEPEKQPQQNNQPSIAVKEAPKTVEQPKTIVQSKTVEVPKPAEIAKSTEPVKTNVTVQATKQALIVKPNISLPLNKDTAILNSSMKGLAFRVQLGAFRNQITTNSSYFDKVNKNAIKEELSPEMLYKYTIGSFDNISRATIAKQVLRETGYSGAFLACYLEGKRVTMDEVLMMLDKKINNRVAINQN